MYRKSAWVLYFCLKILQISAQIIFVNWILQFTSYKYFGHEFAICMNIGKKLCWPKSYSKMNILPLFWSKLVISPQNGIMLINILYVILLLVNQNVAYLCCLSKPLEQRYLFTRIFIKVNIFKKCYFENLYKNWNSWHHLKCLIIVSDESFPYCKLGEFM